MLLPFNNFYKRFGLIRTNQLLSPRVFPEVIFHFPKNAVYHHLTDNDQEFPDTTSALFLDYKIKISMDHIFMLSSHEGNPIKKPIRVLPVIRSFHSKNRIMKYVRDTVKINNNPIVLDVINYNLIKQGYKYTQLPINEYYEWYNIHKTMWKTVEELSSTADKQHYVFINLPEVVPGPATLERFKDKINIAYLKLFDTPERRYILELWKWCDPSFRNTSLFASISESNMSRVNIVFKYKDTWSTVNLDVLNSMIQEFDHDKTPGIIKISYKSIQRYLLKFILEVQKSQILFSDNVEDLENDYIKGVADDIKDYPEEKNDSDSEEISEATLNEDLLELEKIDKKYSKSRSVKILETDEIIINDSEGDVIELTDQEIESIFISKEDKADYILNDIEQLSDDGVMSASEYKGLKTLVEKSKTLKSPRDKTKLLSEAIKINPEELKIEEDDIKMSDSNTVFDKSMLESRLLDFDRKYIKKVLDKDIQSMSFALQKAGIVIHDYTIEEEDNLLGAYEVHTVKVKPIDGASSILKFKLPKVSENGEFYISGNKVRMRKQRVDIPIRKIKPDSVALTSYYGKLFVNRSSKKVNDSVDWVCREILSEGLSGQSDNIKNLVPKNVFDPSLKLPRLFSGISRQLSAFETSKYQFMFDTPVVEEDKVYCGFVKNTKESLYLDYHDNVYVKKQYGLELIGTFYNLINVNQSKMPVDFATVSIFSKDLPVAIVLGYLLGIKKLFGILKIKPKIVERRSRYTLEPHEFEIKFKDKVVILSRNDKLSSMVLAGFRDFKRFVNDYTFDEFNRKNVYFALLDEIGLNSIYIREVDLLDRLFVDPITEGLLKEMKEPTTFKGLIMRSSQLLTTDEHPDLTDMRFMRVRGYERFAGFTYKEMIQAVREYKMKNIRGKSAISLNPYVVWNTVTKDQTTMLVQDINPIDNLKQIEGLTFNGEGGRSKDAMSSETRVFHPSDMGVVSEATSDSADVGVNTYLTANPLFNSVRGTSDRHDFKNKKNASLISTSALVSVGSQNDDTKRVNLISIQQSHTISCEGYHQPLVRTGYEEIIPKRTTDMFSYSAYEDGKVISVNEKGMLIEYMSGEQAGIELGRRFGNAEGHTYPHDIVTSMKAGEKFKKSDVIAYNSGFFEPDFFDNKKIIWKASLLSRTALIESQQTFEDSSAISPQLGSRLQSKVTEIRSIVVDFKQGIKNIVKVGSEVNPTDFLCFIEDELTNDTGLFDEESIELLKRLSNKAPRAKIKGIVDRIEVLYHGDKQDMSSSVRKIADESDRFRAEKNKAMGKKSITGSIDSDYRVNGTPLNLDTCEIKIYITHLPSAGVGDKIVFGNQMKSVVGEVFNYPMTSEDGSPIDAVFGQKSVLARIVLSPVLMGTTNTLLKLIGKKAVEIYNK